MKTSYGLIGDITITWRGMLADHFKFPEARHSATAFFGYGDNRYDVIYPNRALMAMELSATVPEANPEIGALP